MQRTRLEIAPGIVLDARRAVWLKESRTLVVADLHVGYAWAHRHGGQLLPLSVQENTADRLLALVDEYDAAEVVLLGDIVHQAVPVEALGNDLAALFAALTARVAVTCVAGNHDRNLAGLLRKANVEMPLKSEHRLGRYRLVHGDGMSAHFNQDEVIIIGHEHPAVRLSDRVAHAAHCPCFLVAPELIVLPAFSLWAAGGSTIDGRWLSPFSKAVRFETAVAILAEKLLAIPWSLAR